MSKDQKDIFTCDNCSIKHEDKLPKHWTTVKSLTLLKKNKVISYSLLKDSNLHFCSEDCLNKWIKSLEIKPQIKQRYE